MKQSFLVLMQVVLVEQYLAVALQLSHCLFLVLTYNCHYATIKL